MVASPPHPAFGRRWGEANSGTSTETGTGNSRKTKALVNSAWEELLIPQTQIRASGLQPGEPHPHARQFRARYQPHQPNLRASERLPPALRQRCRSAQRGESSEAGVARPNQRSDRGAIRRAAFRALSNRRSGVRTDLPVACQRAAMSLDGGSFPYSVDDEGRRSTREQVAHTTVKANQMRSRTQG
jgi:hypothetical protein